MSPRRREAAVAGLCLAVLVVAALAVTGVLGSDDPGRPAASNGTSLTSSRLSPRGQDIRRLLRVRGQAVVDHDLAGFLATVDPQARRFRRDQAEMFVNLRHVRFASWRYRMSGAGVPVPAAARQRAGAVAWAPARFALRYRLAGFDRGATLLPQYPTFVRRAGSWYLTSLSDFRHRGKVSSTDLWNYQPVAVVRRPRVLVLGSRSQLPTMRTLADILPGAIDRVTGVWGRGWDRRVVVLVPATEQQMARIDAYSGSLRRIAALTSAEVRAARGRPAPVGDRVTINPATWPRLGPLGESIVLTHELTHIATRAATGSQTPKWLSEGFAEYVGFLDSGAPPALAGAELATRVRSGMVPDRLPADRAFRGGSPRLAVAYETAWLACRDLAERYGQRRLVAFYRAVGTSRLPTRRAVAQGLRRTFGLTPRRFDRQWRASLTAVLG